MNKFILNGARIIAHARYAANVEHSGALTDNRFAVINGLLFDVLTIELDDNGLSCTVSVYDATECYNASHKDDLESAYKHDRYIVGFEFYVEHGADNQLCIDADASCEALFLHLIKHALRDSNNARARFANFAIGNDFDHIEGEYHVSQ